MAGAGAESIEEEKGEERGACRKDRGSGQASKWHGPIRLWSDSMDVSFWGSGM